MNKSQIENKTKEATLYLYDEIGFWGTEAKEFVDELQNITADTIHLRINSPGGDVFDARTMQTALKQHSAKIIAHIDGVAASAASVVAMGADEIEMVDGGFLMIHKALSFFDILGYFNDDDLEQLTGEMKKERELLAKVDDSIAKDYMKRTGKKLDEIKGKMADETWFTADEAVEYGMINRIYDGEPVENKHDLTVFLNTPDKLKNEEKAMTKREIERALRDAGCSLNMAKAILAGGWKEDGTQREVEPEPETPQPETQRDVVVESSMLDECDKLINKFQTILE